MKRLLISILILTASAFAVENMPYVAFVGGGGSVKPAATNAVLEAAYAYTDTAISKSYQLSEVHIADGSTNYYPSASRFVMDGNTLYFFIDNSQTLEGEAVFEVYSPDDTPVYIASKSEPIENKVWQLLFTCGTLGSPIDFDLIVYVQPFGLEDKSARQVIFKLRRTF